MNKRVAGFMRAAALLAVIAVLGALALIGFARPHAQLDEQKDVYAVTPFACDKTSSDLDVAASARTAVSDLFQKLEKLAGRGVDVLSDESVATRVSDLGIEIPISRSRDVVRLGTDQGATYVVSGEVANWRIQDLPGGKKADVILQVIVWDVASGAKVNGAAVQGSSGLRVADTSTKVLIEDALSDAASEALRQIKTHILPAATVLTTQGEVLDVNQGSRSGFVKDQRVIIRRGHDQVGEGVVSSVDPESCLINVTRSTKGIEPGDKVQAAYDPPAPTKFFGQDGPKLQKSGGSNSAGLGGLFSVILLVGLVALLFGGSRGADSTLIHNIQAQALNNNQVVVSWQADPFVNGNNAVQWQMWKTTRTSASSVPTFPVICDRNSSARQDYDDLSLDGWNGTNVAVGPGWPVVANQAQCSDITTLGSTTTTTGSFPTVAKPTVGLMNPGTTYYYSGEVVYSVASVSFPNGGGATSGTTTTTGGNCDYVSNRVDGLGAATPLNTPNITTLPTFAAAGTTFTCSSVRGTGADATPNAPIRYVLEVSSSTSFSPKTTTVFSAQGVTDTATPNGGTITLPPVAFQNSFTGTKSLFWRIGVVCALDNPGPVPDSAGARLIVPQTYNTITVP